MNWWLQQLELTEKDVNNNDYDNGEIIINIKDTWKYNQYWNSTLLLWYQLTHYGDTSDILDKTKINYYYQESKQIY